MFDYQEVVDIVKEQESKMRLSEYREIAEGASKIKNEPIFKQVIDLSRTHKFAVEIPDFVDSWIIKTIDRGLPYALDSRNQPERVQNWLKEYENERKFVKVFWGRPRKVINTELFIIPLPGLKSEKAGHGYYLMKSDNGRVSPKAVSQSHYLTDKYWFTVDEIKTLPDFYRELAVSEEDFED